MSRSVRSADGRFRNLGAMGPTAKHPVVHTYLKPVDMKCDRAAVQRTLVMGEAGLSRGYVSVEMNVPDTNAARLLASGRLF